jgi:hypothetical protein
VPPLPLVEPPPASGECLLANVTLPAALVELPLEPVAGPIELLLELVASFLEPRELPPERAGSLLDAPSAFRAFAASRIQHPGVYGGCEHPPRPTPSQFLVN